MKKSLIAGAASVVFAAMPVLDVFTTDATSRVDGIKVTIDPVCALKEVSTGVNYTHTAGASNIGTWSANTLSGKMVSGTSKDNYGSTILTVVRNNKKVEK